MMRVLHVVGDSMSRGGMETFIMNLYRKIDTFRVQFDFLVHSAKMGHYDDEITRLGGRINRIVVDPNKVYFVRVLKRFIDTCRFLKRNREYRIIHIHTSAATSLIELFAAYIMKVPCRIVHSHNTSTNKARLHKVLYPLLVRFSTHRFACSERAGVWMFGKSFMNLKNARVINNGIDTGIFRYDRDKQREIKKELGLEDKLVIGHVGRFEKQKNHEFIIDIFYKLSQKHGNCILLLAGDGSQRPAIGSKVKSLNLESKVMFLGVRSDMDRILLAMDVMLFPSLYEGLPVSLIEAQATGLKIVASDTITKEADITGLIRFMSLDSPAEEWADALLEESDYIRTDATDSIREHNYDIGLIVRELCEIYEQGR